MIAFLGALALLTGPAAAKTYTNATNHYHLTIPDSWNASEASQGVTFMEGSYSTYSISVSARGDSTAKDTDAYTLSLATTQCDGAKNAVGGTYATAPHTITGTTRHAAECVIDYSLLSTAYKMRVTAYGSDGYDWAWVMSANDGATHYATLQTTWDTAVTSFAVDSEPAAPGGSTSTGSALLSGTMLYVIIAVVVVVVLLGVVMMRRGKGKKADAPPAGDKPASPPPQK